MNLLLAVLLQVQPVRIVYSYNRLHYDSLLVVVQHRNKIIHDKNYRLTYTEIDSTNIIFKGTPKDTFEVIIRGYKKNLYCIPFIDKLTYPHFRLSYGFAGFDCIKLIP
jgi:hypothetical protein